MSFLQPWMLLALPLIALPVIIHLINQRRYQTMPWAAMMFLLAANRMSRGYARLRQWLILAMRVLALAGLLFVISRPLASGWLGAAAGRSADTTLVLIDRSPSMQQVGAGTAMSKLDTARRQMTETLETLGSSRIVLIDSGWVKARELESAADLIDAPDAQAAAATADLPAMLQEAYDYVKANRVGRADVWIVSDLRAADWDADSGRWGAIREAFAELPQSTRFHLLAYPQIDNSNASIQITGVRREQREDQAQLLISLRVDGDPEAEGERKIPLQFEIEGAVSELTVSLAGGVLELKDHPLPIDANLQRGWGRVRLPADANPSDDEAFFVFDEPPPRKTVVVAEDTAAARPAMLAAQISSDPLIEHTVEMVTRDIIDGVAWEEVSLLIWQGELPSESERSSIEGFVNAGGQAVFFPPQNPSSASLFGVRWQPWVTADKGLEIEQWRGDQDLLANTISGAALPVGQLRISRYAGIEGRFTPLATLANGDPLLVRVDPDPNTTQGPLGVYFLATSLGSKDSSLARDGVVLYVAMQRAINAGAEALGNTRNLLAGDAVATDWRLVAGAKQALSSEFGIQQGVYQAGERLVAVNRQADEDATAVVAEGAVQQLFRGLDFSRVDDTAGSFGSLVQEIWRLFLILMIAAMILEAALCLPRVRQLPSGAAA